MRLLIAEVGYSTKLKDPTHRKHHHVYIYETNLRKFIIARAYHWYDMRIPIKIPGWRKFIALYRKVTGAENRSFPMEGDPGPRLRDRLVGWEYEQDMRCYHLSLMGRKDSRICLDLTEEQYEQIRGSEMKRLDDDQKKRSTGTSG